MGTDEGSCGCGPSGKSGSNPSNGKLAATWGGDAVPEPVSITVSRPPRLAGHRFSADVVNEMARFVTEQEQPANSMASKAIPTEAALAGGGTLVDMRRAPRDATPLFEEARLPDYSMLARRAPDLGTEASSEIRAEFSDLSGDFPVLRSENGLHYLGFCRIASGPLAGRSLSDIGLIQVQEDPPPKDELEEWAENEKKRCEEQRDDCISGARLDELAGVINQAQYKKRVEECNAGFERCLAAYVTPLQELAKLARVSREVRKQAEEAMKKHQDCVERANQIEDESERIKALAKCYADLAVALEWSLNFGVLPTLPLWKAVNDIFLPTKKRVCPCCVLGKDTIRFNRSGSVDCAESMENYADWGPEYFDPPRDFARTGLVGSRFGLAAYAVEVSIQWTDHTKCPCECEWTQFVKVADGKWFEDRAGREPPDSPKAAENRKKWKKVCKLDRLCIGDVVQQGMYPYEKEKTIFFRTMFYSSSVDCPIKSAYIDWKLRFFRPKPGDKIEAEAIELGRGQG